MRATVDRVPPTSHRGVVVLLAALVSIALSVFLLAMGGGPLRAQGTLPTRLLQPGDLVHQGSFTIPSMREPNNGHPCEWTQGVIAFNPANESLFLVCLTWTQFVAEIKIPALGGQATELQSPRDALEGRIHRIQPPKAGPGSKQIGGMHVAGDQLIVSAFVYYDADPATGATASHFVRSTDLSSASVQGPFRVGSLNPAFYAGYFAPVPAAWQSALGGDLLNGQCCLSIISRTSYGPSVSSVRQADLLAARNASPATMLIGYPADRALAAWNSTGPLFNGTTIMRGVLLPDNTATVLFFGRHGMGKFVYAGGTNAPPYEPHVWAYNAHDLAAVRRGNKRPWDVRPYATWKLADNLGADIGGVALDPATGRIFVTENHGDGVKPRIHVFTIGQPAGPASERSRTGVGSLH
jgi:hypothetical protein